ncbi:hypothetical protein [Streptomyces sp. NPDC055506]
MTAIGDRKARLMTANDHVKLVVGFDDLPHSSNGVRASGTRVFKVHLPDHLDPEKITIATNDLRTLLSSFESHPKEHLALQNAIVTGDLVKARELTNAVGLTEERLSARGGGQVGEEIIIIAILCALLLSHD